MSEFECLDIETTGLLASECELVSWCVGKTCIIQDNNIDETTLIEQMFTVDRSELGLLTYMGGTLYSPGFDFPFLRTRCAMMNVPFPFIGLPHIDIFPIIQKRFDTKISYYPVLEDLVVDDLKKIVKNFGIDAKPKKKQEIVETINNLLDPALVSKYINDTFPAKTKDLHSLKDVYELLTGEDPGDMRGDQVPILWKQYNETHDNSVLDDIVKYNMADCQKVENLWEIIQGCVPARDLMPEIL